MELRKVNDISGCENYEFFEYIIDYNPYTGRNGGGTVDIRVYKDEDALDNKIYTDLYFDDEFELYSYVANMENVGDC